MLILGISWLVLFYYCFLLRIPGVPNFDCQNLHRVNLISRWTEDGMTRQWLVGGKEYKQRALIYRREREIRIGCPWDKMLILYCCCCRRFQLSFFFCSLQSLCGFFLLCIIAVFVYDHSVCAPLLPINITSTRWCESVGCSRQSRAHAGIDRRNPHSTFHATRTNNRKQNRT